MAIDATKIRARDEVGVVIRGESPFVATVEAVYTDCTIRLVGSSHRFNRYTGRLVGHGRGYNKKGSLGYLTDVETVYQMIADEIAAAESHSQARREDDGMTETLEERKWRLHDLECEKAAMAYLKERNKPATAARAAVEAKLNEIETNG